MTNLATGLAALAAFAILTYAASRSLKARPGLAGLLIGLAAFLLRLEVAADHFLHTWDERYHALVAKHLLLHPLLPTLYERALLPYDFRDWRANHIWVHKPPLALWLMAGGMRVFGVSELAMRLPGVLLAGISVWATFVIARRWCGGRVALLAAALHAGQGYLLQLPAGRVAVDHVDNALIVLVELAILFAVLGGERSEDSTEGGGRSSWTSLGWPLLVGFTTGLAVLAKWLPGLLPIPVWFALVAGRQRWTRILRDLALLAAALVATVLPWQLYVHRAFPLETSWESFYSFRHLEVPIEGLGGSPLYFIERMPRFFGELVYLPAAWFLLVLVLGLRRGEAGAAPADLRRAAGGRRALAALAVWWLLPYGLFSLAATKLNAYVMTAAPALCIIQAMFWMWLADRWREARAGHRHFRGELVLESVLLVLLLALPLRYTLERLKLRSDYDRDPAWAQALRRLPTELGNGPLVLCHFDRPIEAMYYTPYIAYETLSAEEAQQIVGAGVRVVVLDAGSAPASLRAVPGVELREAGIPAGPIDDGTGYRPRRADGSDSPLSGLAVRRP